MLSWLVPTPINKENTAECQGRKEIKNIKLVEGVYMCGVERPNCVEHLQVGANEGVRVPQNCLYDPPLSRDVDIVKFLPG